MRAAIRFSRALAAWSFLLSLDALAVTSGIGGQGQVLLYPYYTVNAGQNTLWSVSNLDGAAGKLLRVRFREGANSRSVMEFNVFLAPHDTWTATVFTLGEGKAASIATSDDSCALATARVEILSLPGGQKYHTFYTDNFTGAHSDVYADTTPARTREGFFEVFEMSALPRPSSQTAAPEAWALWTKLGWLGDVRDCNAAVAWLDAHRDSLLSAPTGSLAGSESLVNPLEGTLQSIAATPLDEFRRSALYSEAGTAHPNLGDVEADVDGKFHAKRFVNTGGEETWLDLRLDNANAPVDVVSAVLALSDLASGDVIADAAKGEATDWVVTLPTVAFYTDPEAGAVFPMSVSSPFFSLQGPDVAHCEHLHPIVSARDGEVTRHCEDSLNCPAGTQDIPPQTCAATTVMTFGRGNTTPSAVLGSRRTTDVPFTRRSDGAVHEIAHEGTVTLDGMYHGMSAVLPPRGVVVYGLPALVFSATAYANHNVTPGVLANYTVAAPIVVKGNVAYSGFSVRSANDE